MNTPDLSRSVPGPAAFEAAFATIAKDLPANTRIDIPQLAIEIAPGAGPAEIAAAIRHALARHTGG
jgi:hypothetical protein